MKIRILVFKIHRIIAEIIKKYWIEARPVESFTLKIKNTIGYKEKTESEI